MFPQMRLLAWMLLPPPDDELELIRACQNVVGGFIEMALRLPNGDAVCVNRDATSPTGFFWLPCAPKWLPGPGLIVGPCIAHDVQSTYGEILDVTRLSLTGTDPLPRLTRLAETIECTRKIGSQPTHPLMRGSVPNRIVRAYQNAACASADGVPTPQCERLPRFGIQNAGGA